MTMKIKTFAIALLLGLFLILMHDAEGAVSMSASATKIPRGQHSLVTISYQVSGASLSTVTSPLGFFRMVTPSGVVTLGTAGTPLSIPIAAGNGSATETIDIPISVIQGAISRRSTQFYFERSFVLTPVAGPVPYRVNFEITSEATSDLIINTMNLYFENRRPEVTIEKGYRGLKAYADIGYAGSGLFEGYWEVDGRVLSRVFESLTFGGVLHLQTPEIPELPTFDPGSHRLRFVVTRPVQPIAIPTAIYFVDLNLFKPAYLSVILGAPEDGSSVALESPKFEWHRPGAASMFLVQFGDKLDAKAVFSAYTKDVSYVLPPSVVKDSFSSGQQYFWKVIAFDGENNIIGESRAQSFVLGK
jgi:hypothetical protein